MSTRDDILTALATGVRSISKSTTYDEVPIAEVLRYEPQFDELPDEDFPLVYLADEGSTIGPERDGARRVSTILDVVSLLRTESTEMIERNERLSAAIGKYLHSNPAVDTALLDLTVLEEEIYGLFRRGGQAFAGSLHRIRLLWWEQIWPASSPAGTDTYGDQWLDTARDKIEARVNLLKTTMASGYDPTFGYVYPRHLIPELQLNAVSIGIDGAEGTAFGSGDGLSRTYKIRLSIRIHTAYDDQDVDDQEATRLANGVINQLANKQNLEDGYRILEIDDLTVPLEFEASRSKGAQFAVTIQKHVYHTQE